jgi:hypothetical protein
MVLAEEQKQSIALPSGGGGTLPSIREKELKVYLSARA